MPPSAFRPMMPGWSHLADVMAEAHRNEPTSPIEYTEQGPIDTGDPFFMAKVVPILTAGNNLVSDRRMFSAFEKYKEAIPIIVGDDFEVPLSSSRGGLYSTKYVELPLWRRIALMQICNTIGEVLIKLDSHEEALQWFLEVGIIYKNASLHDKHKVLFDWFRIDIPWNAVYLERVHAMVHSSNIFLKLGNTSMAAHRRVVECTKIVFTPLRGFEAKSLEGKEWASGLQRLPTLRHPDPRLNLKHNIQCESLQIMGSWSKIHISSNKNIQPRSEFASFVWNGRYYVAGGEKTMGGPFFRDIRYIVLSDMEAGWHFHLPSYPIRRTMGGRMSNWTMRVDDNKAYIFNGSPQVDYFDLVTEKWSTIRTRFPSSLNGADGPFPREDLQDYSMIAYEGKLYVFGGTYEKCEVGNNLLMELDLKTHQWRKLSGYPGPKLTAEYNTPGPRRYTTIWLDKQIIGEEKIFLLYGDADRVSARQGGQEHGESMCYGYDDMWSWDIRNERWRRERIEGNPPSPRSEIGCTFNEKLGVVALFGGYSPTLETHLPEQGKYHTFTYFGDTYIYCPSHPGSTERPKFKQVITRGFPTYRAGAHLFTDPENGRIYLFGGYTNSQLIPEPRADEMRSYADLWQLRLDLSGGDFDNVNLEEEARTAKAGPWQRCFTCGTAGPWKKCGGSCNGRAFFCDGQCLKEGWKDHKAMHNCRKK